jgi:hypothetical protein
MSLKYTHENEFWFFFGYAEGWPHNKCDECYELVEVHKKPNRHCINCWKLEIFFSNTTDINAVKDYFLKEGQKDHTLHGKWSKYKMEIPRNLLTSIPKSAHPDDSVEVDGGILIYCQCIEERDRRRKKIFEDLSTLGLYKKSDISYRRGCLNFDVILGPWKDWYEIDKDFGQ